MSDPQGCRMNPRNSPEKYSPHKNSVSKMRPESSFNYDASRILTNRARIRASKHYPHTRFPNEDWTPKGILLRKYGKTKQSGNTKDVLEKSQRVLTSFVEEIAKRTSSKRAMTRSLRENFQ
ncbi:hypothetical protein [Penguinpox virus 2]|nr:hypothetical protein [Penguinpox virus 2]QRM15955.1 hypothetical protein [Penguinpox virus 2]